MAIYTRFGSKVTIISVEQDNQNTWLKVRLEDGSIREWAAYEFRADGGLAEIQAVMGAIGITRIEYTANNEPIAAPAAAPEAKEAASEPTSAPETVDGSMRPCEHCNGSGHVTRSGLYIVPCPECDGTGIHTEPTLLTPDDIIALAIDDIRDQRRPANPARFADNVQSAIDSIRAENKALKQRLAAAQKALVAIVSIKYDDMQAIRDRAETGLIESDYYVASLK